jgi:hypothetical protein
MHICFSHQAGKMPVHIFECKSSGIIICVCAKEIKKIHELFQEGEIKQILEGNS